MNLDTIADISKLLCGMLVAKDETLENGVMSTILLYCSLRKLEIEGKLRETLESTRKVLGKVS